MKRLTVILLLASVCITLFSCRTRTTRQAMKHGEVLKTNLDSFEKNRQKLSTNLVESLEEAKESLTAENPNIPEVSKDFEKEWRSIMSRYNKLNNDLPNKLTALTKLFAVTQGSDLVHLHCYKISTA